MSLDNGSVNLDSLELSDCRDEISIQVPATFASFPLGFAIDAGGSVTKLVYRSKLDYTDGKSNSDKEVLRIRFIPNGNNDGEELIRFIKENCDVRMTSSEERPLYYQTGVGMQHYFKKLEENFACRIKIMPEMEMGIASILHVSKLIPQLNRTVSYNVESIAGALGIVRDFLGTMQKFKEVGLKTIECASSITNDVATYIARLMSVWPTALVDELNSRPMTFPCLLVQCGSATNAQYLRENGDFAMGDFSPSAGKTFLAIGRLITGAKSFDELMELASRGDYRKVHQLSGDLKNANHKDVDWYSLMPENFPVFLLGKAAEARFDGTYSKSDLAAGLLHMQCDQLSHLAVNAARIHRVSSVVFVGSFVNWPLVRRVLQQCFLAKTLLMPIMGEGQVTMHILPHSAFLTAIGTWHENIKQLD